VQFGISNTKNYKADNIEARDVTTILVPIPLNGFSPQETKNNSDSKYESAPNKTHSNSTNTASLTPKRI